MENWIKTSEKKPKENEIILVYLGDGCYSIASYYSWAEKCFACDEGVDYAEDQVLYWRYLPQPPNDEF